VVLDLAGPFNVDSVRAQPIKLQMMKTKIALAFVAATLLLAGCCTTHDRATARWEYKTLVLPNDAVPLEPSGSGWTSDDAVLNAMLKDGWVVAGYGIDHINSQWFLLKRHKNDHEISK
jgi:hypothetical protein